ncbi:hypothetical protein [Klebsiella pneumoniae]|uniref:hypothetical protein n=1 Tax=Klebsiella pneumoniae TaxID=573 RepID=UPI0007CBA6B8|nr:hypothetical protein [Klebsiella pneumoniae]SAS94451.1 Uncharacterised protein [Klebsiella pneumoniae]SAT49299.1 Uncharacterised protein [Klebsiella pneumoniae]
MPITAILLDMNGPVIPGMKTLDDFTISNWFVGLPEVSATPFAGYYFGEPAPDITYNSYNKNAPAVINGSLNNADGYISVNNTDYLDTSQKAPLTLTICGVAKRNAGGASLNAHMLADFSGSGSTESGFSIGFTNGTGNLFCVGQNNGQSSAGYAYAAFPASIAVGDLFAFAASITQGTVTVDIYNPQTGALISSSAAFSGTRVAGTNNVLLGRKTDNNNETTTKYIKSVLLMEGVLTSAEKVSVSQFLLSME